MTTIGVMDSGVGGLSVLAALARLRPDAHLVYYADSAHLPYGEKTEAFIRERVLAIGHLLAGRGCSPIVVACNTATAAAIEALRAALPHIPIVGVEPGVKPAAQASRQKRIAVLATRATIHSARLARLVERHAGQVDVLLQPCPGWADWVETLALEHDALIGNVRERIAPLVAAGADQFVLGCTHYSFLTPLIREIAGPAAGITDIAEAVALQASRLSPPPSGATDGRPGRLALLASGEPARLDAALHRLGLTHLAARERLPA